MQRVWWNWIYVLLFFLLRVDPSITTFVGTTGRNTLYDTQSPSSRTSLKSTNDRSSFERPYRYRNARESDIPQLSKLLVETFDDDETNDENTTPDPFRKMFDWLGRVDQLQEKKLRRRWNDLIMNPAVAHSWIVAEGNGPSVMGEIVGFVELGTMPIPVPILAAATTTTTTEGSNIQEDITPEYGSRDSNSMSDIWKDLVDTQRTEPKPIRIDRPFLANLAVARSHRRRGIASTLVELALRQSKKWKPPSGMENHQKDIVPWSMFLGVGYDNDSAIRLYESLNFTLSLDETNSLSPKMLKRLKRTPRLYFEKKLE